MPDLSRLTRPLGIAAAILVLALQGQPVAAQTPLKFSLPIDCVPGLDCWIFNYFDSDASAAAKDFRCGLRTYDKHDGADFAVRDRVAMVDGVEVLAAAAGVVEGVRVGMFDMPFQERDPKAIKGRECGNGMVIDHGSGWKTQYCHLRERSTKVKTGDRVTRGQPLGVVGMSGKTEFPHLHFEVRFENKSVDPFVGLGKANKCAMGEQPLWTAETAKCLVYRTTDLFNAGFSQVRPSPEMVRAGLHRDPTLSKEIRVVYMWLEGAGGRAGDVLTLRLRNPTGKQLAARRFTLKRNWARFFSALSNSD